MIVEAESSEEARELAENEDFIVEEEEIQTIRKTTNSEKIYFAIYE